MKIHIQITSIDGMIITKYLMVMLSSPNFSSTFDDDWSNESIVVDTEAVSVDQFVVDLPGTISAGDCVNAGLYVDWLMD